MSTLTEIHSDWGLSSLFQRVLLIGFLGGIMLSSAACRGSKYMSGPRVIGDGHVISSSRSFAGFHSVQFDGSFIATIQQAPGKAGAVITADSNLLPYIHTEMSSDGELSVYTSGTLETRNPIRIAIQAPDYQAITVNGSTDVTSLDTIQSPSLRLIVTGSGSCTLALHTSSLSSGITGSGTVTLTGYAEQHDASLTGSGNLTADSLLTQRTNIALMGSGNARIYVTKQLSAKLVGAGNLYYKGSANDVHTSRTGAGTVQQLQDSTVATRPK